MIAAEAQATHDKPVRCHRCDSTGVAVTNRKLYYNGVPPNGVTPGECVNCRGVGWFGIDPELPIPLVDGPERVKYYQVRYASGVLLFDGLK